MIKQRTGLTIISFGVSFILLTLISLNVSGSSEAYSQAANMTQSKNVNDSIQSENDNRSLIGSVINITNNTNPIGAAIQQMIQATSTSNTTLTSNTTNSTS
jgi:hypothetical protein